MRHTLLLSLAGLASRAWAAVYTEANAPYNLNTNPNAAAGAILDYSGEWENHTFNPSPPHWRYPTYTIILDKWVDGDPTNNDIGGTVKEYDIYETGFRAGGDVKGLQKSLAYLEGMGVKVVYIAGSPFLNQPWGADGYSPLDFTLLDPHFGTVEEWREMIQELHNRGMYLIMDLTVATLGDLVGFQGYLNTSTPFSLNEHTAVWKTALTYPDFNFTNTYNDTCQMPRFWGDDGYPVTGATVNSQVGCYNSDFDQYGDTEAFGVFPDWQRQLSKFASVQDRLRDWKPGMSDRLGHLACLVVSMLDVDGVRLDKATQMTVDFTAEWSTAVRQCAVQYNKKDFMIMGEVTGGDYFGSIYYGRGRQPDQRPPDILTAMSLHNDSDGDYWLHPEAAGGFDNSAFHYSIYRAITRFLGMDGNLQVAYDINTDFVTAWNEMMVNNDFLNAMTGQVDPRHMFATTNQDLFRWPAISDGAGKQMLGLMIVTLLLPGVPLLYYGEEQLMYLLDNTAQNYMYGRQPIVSTVAWQSHGCYRLGSQQYYEMDLGNAMSGCEDDWNSLDHRDSSHPARNILKGLYDIRDKYTVVRDGWALFKLGNWTENVFFPGSGNSSTEKGLYSIAKNGLEGLQDDLITNYNQSALWLLYTNNNATDNRTWSYDCMGFDPPIIAPYTPNTTIKSLMWPYEEYTLEESLVQIYQNGSGPYHGCLPNVTLEAYGWRAFINKEYWVERPPVITRFSPGHDARVEMAEKGVAGIIPLTFEFSEVMDCNQITKQISLESKTSDGSTPTISTATCQNLTVYTSQYVGSPGSVFSWSANLTGVMDGVHAITLSNVTTAEGNSSLDGDATFFVRYGLINNPIVFPRVANYSSTLLTKDSDDNLQLNQTAAGADMFRYSTDWVHYSDWYTYKESQIVTINETDWSGTKAQEWAGEHVMVQYYSSILGSSHHIQHGDVDYSTPRRFPNIWAMGVFNEWGYDSGVDNQFKLDSEGKWRWNYMATWPASLQLNMWGMNPDGKPDAQFVYGDIDGDGTIDRLSPATLTTNLLNITLTPPKPYLSWQIVIDDGTRQWYAVPKGSWAVQIAMFIIMAIVPVLTAIAAVLAFRGSFYKIKFNTRGNTDKKSFIPLQSLRDVFRSSEPTRHDAKGPYSIVKAMASTYTLGSMAADTSAVAAVAVSPNKRRSVIIATLEYDISDWNIKIKIGGLGVMAQLMGKNLEHQDLIWVVPKVGGIDYPEADYCPPIEVKILNKFYQIGVQSYQQKNITYILLDAPVFRRQSQVEPYPARMDDLESAIFYSAWNQCIAECIRRYKPDMYHINDYHGALAPCYLLPDVIPCALSLHNAEFQGLWPLRSQEEKEEVCAVFNISQKICTKYVQYGNVFNLLHAGASYLRIHQKGFGAVGVSNKYGKRSWARYPIFWGLSKIGTLPNPDPSDTGDIDPDDDKKKKVVVDKEFEARRHDLKRQAQEWAGLKVDPKAELLVFVGRWSMQKGVDLIADLLPTLLQDFPVQLIAVGPVIDLYGKFAAEKLDVLMKKYPDRVFSKPEFTQLPPFIFSGADFALIPSRDEPFGLVAVEFGRKGALGIGARVGGLGAMPGWWYTVESATASHLIQQFESASRQALSSKQSTRAELRAKSAKQRFPVKVWVKKLDDIQNRCIIASERVQKKRSTRRTSAASSIFSSSPTPNQGTFSRSSPGYADPHTPSYSPSITDLSPTPDEDPYLHGSPSSFGDSDTGEFSPYEDSPSISPAMSPTMSPTMSPVGSPRNGGSPNPSGASVSRYGSKLGPGHNSRPRHGNGGIETVDEEEIYLERPMSEDDWDGMSDNESVFYDPQRGTVLEGYFDRDPESRRRSRQQHSLIGLGISDSNDSRETVRLGEVGRGEPTVVSHGHVSSWTPIVSGHSGPWTPSMPSEQGVPIIHESPLRPSSSSQSTGTGTLGRTLGAGATMSTLSLATVMTDTDKPHFKLTDTEKNFTDEDGKVMRTFASRLENLNSKNSKDELCIENFLVKSERAFFNDVREKKLGIVSSRPASIFSEDDMSRSSPEQYSPAAGAINDMRALNPNGVKKPPRGIKLLMQRKLGDWPVYSIFLALGQVLAATAFQLNLLGGSSDNSAIQIYSIGTVYFVSCAIWWTVFRLFPSIHVLHAPFYLYALAFFMIGIPGLHDFGIAARSFINHGATWVYAGASASGAFYFSLNFGDEGGARLTSWVFRACVIQGTQQIWAAALWYWGHKLTVDAKNTPGVEIGLTTSVTTTVVTWVLAGLMTGIGVFLYVGLPDFYRQMPGKVPAFYRSLMRRHVVMWFLFSTILQTYWLSTVYGRNWTYLWNSSLKTWETFLLLVGFFVGVWSVILYFLGRAAKTHSWFIPVFAIGLGAPRWAQLLWSTSNIGLSLPWAGAAGPYLGTSLWLWLGVLDAIQGVGLGMILLQTLTRFHVAVTLVAAQMVGALVAMLARATAPDKVGPSGVFPDASAWNPTTDGAGPWSNWMFWFGLVCQIVICVGYLRFFRKEQLSKP
ncbi:putative cell wall alpha-glucan synthase [Saitoella complicata NRRL Y-17804]|nr:putative cell wall alpha-glucan synthase [Saitoella complicata NRRL Y-17804]ODQ52039.1 putative cell wall alpha-glucan synthase [Saitoella complicata NRRL Y-17804]